jgi:osmotically-inducible protein OsmY
MKLFPSTPRLVTLGVSVLILSAGLSACAPLLLGGAAVGGALMVSDRRTSGTQLEDEGIQIKASNRLKDKLGDRAHLSVASYNRVALVTGEVATEADRATVDGVVAGVENVRSVVNEAAVAGNSSLTSRSNDLIIGSKVKATLVDAADVQANAFKVVVERGVVYLMGRSVSGVQKVVRVFEVLTEDELKALTPNRKP